MKSTLFAIAMVFVLASCSDETTGASTPNTTPTANLSFKIGSDSVMVNAKWKTLPNNRWRIYWEETVAGVYKNIEIDLYGNTPGNYTVQSSPDSAGEAGFQYFIQNGANYSGVSGTIVLTSFTGDKMNGTFALTTKIASGVTQQVTDGKFVDIPKE